KAAAEYAGTLPEGEERSFAMSAALRNWAASDAVEAATWMTRFEASKHFDMGAAVIASHPDAIKQPYVALGWAHSIENERLRARVLASVVKEWSATDPVAARKYAESSSDIRAEDRELVMSAFEPGFKGVTLAP